MVITHPPGLLVENHKIQVFMEVICLIIKTESDDKCSLKVQDQFFKKMGSMSIALQIDL